MKLKQYIKENPSHDLATIQAHSEQGSKMISPDMMVAFLATFGIGKAVEVEDTEAAFALRKALQFGSEFNLINGHPASVEPLLNQINAASGGFKAYIKAYANPVKTPFASATQEEVDAIKAELAASGEAVGVTHYDQLNSTQQWHVRDNKVKTEITVKLDNGAVGYDTKIKVFVSKKSGIDGTWVEQPTPINSSVVIKANEPQTTFELENFYGRQTQYRLVSDRVDSFTVLVTAISKY